MRRSTLSLLLLPILLASCVKEEVVTPRAGTSGGLGPALVVEQFMRALNTEPKDLAAMGRLFGTKDGPIGERDPRQLVEQRMFAIATILRHEDYQVVREQQVPGRTGEATQLIVRVTATNKNTANVPFTLVRYKDSGWLIEQIGIDAITNQK